MKRVMMCAGLATTLLGAAPVFALEIEPTTRQKAIAAASAATAAPATLAPTLSPGLQIQLPDLPGADSSRRLTGSCNLGSVEVCYDYKEGRLVYRGSRNWMPEFVGLTPEHISVKRDSIIFRYSFK